MRWKFWKREEPKAGISSSHELYEFLLRHGSESEAGVSVTRETALEDPTVWACLKVLSEAISQIPLHVLRRTPDGREVTTDSDANRILRVKPNGWMTAREFRRLVVFRAALTGDFVAVKNIVRGKLVEVLPVDSDRVTIDQREDFSIRYKIETPGGTTKEYPPERIFHFRGLSADGLTGIDPIAKHKTIIGLSMALDRYGARLFKNGAHPRVLLSTDETLNEGSMKRIVESLKAATGGEKQHSTLVLDGGLKPSRMSLSNEEAQYNETRRNIRSIIAAIWRIPPHMVNDLERATFSNIEHLGRGFVDYTLMPWLVSLEEAFDDQLLSEGDRRRGYYIKHNVNALLRGDSRARSEFYSKAVQSGWMSRNEVREREDMDPGPEELDEFLEPENMREAGEEDERPLQPDEA